MNKTLISFLTVFFCIFGSLCAMERPDMVMTKDRYVGDRPVQTFSHVCEAMSQMSVERARVFFEQDMQSFCRTNNIYMQQSYIQLLADIFVALQVTPHSPQEPLLGAVCTMRDHTIHLAQNFLRTIGADFVDSDGNTVLQIAINKANIELIEWLSPNRFQAQDHVVPASICPFDQVAIDSML